MVRVKVARVVFGKSLGVARVKVIHSRVMWKIVRCDECLSHSRDKCSRGADGVFGIPAHWRWPGDPTVHAPVLNCLPNVPEDS